MAVVAFTTLSMLPPTPRTGLFSIIQIAEGIFVNPRVFSVTVQVRVRLVLPATSGPDCDTAVFTSRESRGTGEEDLVYTIPQVRGNIQTLHFYHYCLSVCCSSSYSCACEPFSLHVISHQRNGVVQFHQVISAVDSGQY